MNFSFDYPWVLTGLAVFVILFLYDIFSGKKKHIRKILPPPLLRRLFVSSVFFRLFLALFIIALSGPRWGREESADGRRRSLDVVAAIDVSRSMEIRDAAGANGGGEAGRLVRGLTIVRQALAAVPSLRAAAAVSRGRGMLAVPLTWDNEAVFNFLESLDGSSLSGSGTNLESLLDAAAQAFQHVPGTRKMIILVSDGEALSGNFKAAVDRCIRDEIMICAVATGSDEGRPVPGLDGTISRRNSGALRMAAEKTGGLYIDGARNDAAALLAGSLRSRQGWRTNTAEKNQKQRWFLFAMLAIIFLGISKISLLRFKKRKEK